MASSTMEESKLHGGYLVTPRVPQGLAAAVEGLTREVIRHSPEDIYVFAAHHFEKLLSIRERCGSEDVATHRYGNFRTLREMSQAPRMREIDPTNARTMRSTSDQVGWSLNQTAKVLKRHRSIFGDTGRRISTDEVFQMANQKENRPRTFKPCAEKKDVPGHVQRKDKCPSNQKSFVQIADDVWKASGSRHERSRSNEGSPEIISEARVGPRIITQIPSLQSSTKFLAKDIKSELRKNRISSRERRNVWAKPDDGIGQDRSEVKSGPKALGRHSKKSSERDRNMETDGEKRNRRIVDSTRSPRERQDSHKMPESRALSMDRVKDYVVQRFATTKSLEELQTLNYVEKVQEIIDETGPIIKGKVEELKSGMIGRSKRSSWFADDRNDDSQGSNVSGTDNRDSRRNSHHKDSRERLEAMGPTADVLRTRLTETQHLLENVSSKISIPRRSRSARASRRSAMTSEEVSSTKDSSEEEARASNRDNGLERRLSKTRNLLEDISSTLSKPMRRSNSAKNLRRHEENDDFGDVGSKDALKTRLDETRNLLEGISASLAMPGSKVGSAYRRRNKHGGNLNNEEMTSPDSQNTSKVSLPAVKSISAKSSSGSVSRNDSDFVLPAISPEVPKSKKVKENLILPVLSPSGNGSSSEESKIEDDVNIFAEEDIPEIPVEDYIPEPTTEDVFRDSLNVTPDFDSIPQRPDSLEPIETAEDIEDTTKTDNLEDRLREIQKVGMKIEQALTSTTPANPLQTDNVQNSDTTKPLNEFEEAAKIIEGRSANEVCKGIESSSKIGTIADTSVEAVDESNKSGKDVQEEIVSRKFAADENESNEREEASKNDEQQTVDTFAPLPESFDNTYVLTEGSPHEIPDSVTTVIIPERTVHSPGLEILNEEFGEAMDPNSFSFCGNATTKESDKDEKIDDKFVENIDGNVRMTVIDPTDAKSTNPSSPKNGYQSNEDNYSPKNTSDPFGEFVEPEKIELASCHIDFISDIESRPEIHISHQDLGRINEEIAEELEGLDERNEVAKLPKTIETVEKTKEEEIAKATNSPIIENVKVDDIANAMKVEEAIKAAGTIETLEETNEEVTKESIGSPGGLSIEKDNENDKVARVQIDETSETLKTIDKVTETKKGAEEVLTISPNGSMTEKDVKDGKSKSTEAMEITRTTASEREDRNEVEGTTSSRESSIIGSDRENDAPRTREVDLSKSRTASDLSPEACRPNVDSQSSNEAKESSEPDEPLESGKCVNSLDDEDSTDGRSPESSNEVKETTLTDGLSLSLDPTRPFVPELNLDSLQDITVSSFKMTEDEYDNQGPGGSGKTNSIADTLTFDENHRIIDGNEFAEEAVLEYLVSSSERSRADEVSNEQGEVVEEPIVKSHKEIKEDICVKTSAYITGPNYEEESLTNVDDNLDKDEREIRSEVEEEDEKKDMTECFTDENTTEIEKTKEKEDKADQSELENTTEDESSKKSATETVTYENLPEEQKKKVESESPVRKEKVEAVASHGEDDESSEKKSNDESASSEVKKEEEIDEDRDGSSGACAPQDSNDENSKAMDQSTREPGREDLSEGTRSTEEGSEEMLEESFVEEDTPLAVSRSASQCTTRRVSSGNLARLREDPTHGWTEETKPEIVDEEDGSSSKVKFSTIGSEIIREQSSSEADQSQDSESPKNLSDDSNENVSKYSREYHIYVPEVDTSDDRSTTQSSTVESAVTKIQARVRGFLTRRRIHQGQHNRSSTLSSIPSIQDSIVVDPCDTNGQQSATEGRSYGGTEETNVSSAMALDEPELENAATRIQSNYRGYKARKRLRREDAVQRTTLSVEKSFAESGLQHTGEFHDCIALPIHDITLDKKSTGSGYDRRESSPPHSESKLLETEIKNDEKKFEKILQDTCAGPEGSRIPGKMFFGQSPDVPVIQFGMRSNIADLVDLVVLAKEEAVLENSYLDFITSVEDAEVIEPKPASDSSSRLFTGENCSNESSKEPLALSATPVAMVIEEITNSDVERFLNQRSLESSILSPEKATESPSTARSSCASSKTISESMEGSKMEDSISETPVTRETTDNRESPDHNDGNLVVPAASLRNKFGIVESFSLPEEKELLGPESSVDSMECPVIGSADKSSSSSSAEVVQMAEVTKKVGEPSYEGQDSCDRKDSSRGAEVIGQASKEVEGSVCNMVEASPTLSFSLMAEDLLGIGSEDSTRSHRRKPILEVTVHPGDIMKSMSLSQESQLAGERIESPITMVQLAPARSDSLQLDEPSKSSCEDDESSMKPSAGSDHKLPS